MLKLLSFQGKSDRFEWWATTIIAGIVFQLAFIFGLLASLQASGTSWPTLIASLMALVLSLWITLAVTAKRFRDCGQSPWMTLVGLIPMIGELWIVIVCGFFPNPRIARKKKLVRRTVE